MIARIRQFGKIKLKWETPEADEISIALRAECEHKAVELRNLSALDSGYYDLELCAGNTGFILDSEALIA